MFRVTKVFGAIALTASLAVVMATTTLAASPPTAPTVPSTALPVGGAPLALSLTLTLSLILIGALAVMMSSALFRLARLGPPNGRGRRS